jgi:hypothetical protein
MEIENSTATTEEPRQYSHEEEPGQYSHDRKARTATTGNRRARIGRPRKKRQDGAAMTEEPEHLQQKSLDRTVTTEEPRLYSKF